MRLKIWVLAFFVVVLSAPSGFAEAMDKNWDFENGADGWSAWGLPGGMTPEVISRIASISQEQPHQGKQCLMVRDELDNVNPYAEWQEFVIIVDKIPPETKTLRPTVFVFDSPARDDRSRKGAIYLDDLRFGEYTSPSNQK